MEHLDTSLHLANHSLKKLEIVKRYEGGEGGFIARTLQLPQSTISIIIKQAASSGIRPSTNQQHVNKLNVTASPPPPQLPPIKTHYQ
ncbi:hypothetical protein E2C01_060255 [Portunus trituberculatus]|uniref:Uncharacterized protein n=1 Tax=Portunus trituberculatus TaxID=210409 RepID=A0A5B7H0G8_PORTR|nr:hypothetical protein [Portunus trituberculatus]